MTPSLVLSGRGQGAGKSRLLPSTFHRLPTPALRPPPSGFPLPASRYPASVHVHLQVHESLHHPPLATRHPLPKSKIRNPKFEFPISHLLSSKRPPTSRLPPSTKSEIQNIKYKTLSFFSPEPLTPLTLKTSCGGFALVATLLMITVITGAAVAFFQSTRIERLVTRNYAEIARAQLAAQAGLSAGQAAILNAITNGRISTNQWNYVSGHLSTHPQITANASNADANAFAFIAQIDPNNSSILTNTFLASTSAAASNSWIPLGQTGADPRFPAHWTNVVVSNASGVVTTNARYAFWISDDTTKLNLRAMGSQATRTYPTDPSGFALMVRSTATSSLSTRLPAANLLPLFRSQTQQAADGTTLRGWNGADLLRPDSALFTPGTVKAFMTNAGLTPIPIQSLENDFARETLSIPLAPNGRPKLNLTRLKTYLDSLPRSQASGNLRYQLILDILNSASTNVHTNWGGGDLSFLTDATIMGSKYTATEARQFVANLFDAIDEDLAPTTNDSNNPTIFGVEFRTTNNSIQGHPYITYVGTGHFAGSTRVRTHMAVGFANPWPEPTEPWANYRVDLEVAPSSPPFPPIPNEEMAGMPTAVRATNGGISARTGGLFPCANAAAPHYSAFVNTPPPAIPNLTFTLVRVNLYYNSSGGGSYLVARVPPGQVLQALPSSIPAGGDGGVNRLAWANGRQAYWAQTDPRLATTAAAGNWTDINNGAGGANGIIPAPSTTITYMASASTGDGNQGLARRITTSMPSTDANNWYRSTNITNHFNLDGSIEFDSAKNINRIKGLGFLGYINSGKPWRTVSLSTNNNPAGQEDWKILDYVYAGDEIYASNEIAHVNMGAGNYAPGGARGSWPGNFSRDGSINVLTANKNTWKALLAGVPLPPGVTADGVAAAMVATNRTTNVYSNTLAFLADPDVSAAWAGSSANDFVREQLFRYLADALTTRSRSFTIYAMGESLATNASGGIRPVARSLMLSRVRLGVNINLATNALGNGGGVTLEVLETKPY